MKKFISILLVISMILCLCACSKNGSKDEPKENKGTNISQTDNTNLFSSELLEIPDGYLDEIDEGSVPTEEISYTHLDHEKKAVVYLPPNYNEESQYDVLYIVPGYGGAYDTYFNEAGDEATFKNLLDNMIINGEMNPCIVVAPGFYPSDKRMGDITLDELLDDFSEELFDYIMPIVESKYSTYSKGTTKEDFVQSREHRAFAGCSMGGAICWYMLASHLEYFKYFAPTAAGSFEDYYDGYDGVGGALRSELSEKNYSPTDYFVFGCDGTDDVTYDKMEALIDRFKSDYTDVFTFTDDDKSQGNITYKVLEGGEHNYDYMYIYLYNALQTFWK